MSNSDDLAKRRARLTPEQRSKLTRRLSAAASNLVRPEAVISPRDSREPALLSYAQQRQWFLWQLEPLSTAYHLSGALRLVGKLDIEVLQASFQALVARHEALRTVFRVNAQGLPEQLVEAERKLEIPLIDLCDWPAEQRARHAQEAAKRINAAAFDLTRDPLLRLALIRITPEEHLLVVVMHHIISDAWSNHILIEEFAAQYRARLQGREPSLPALTIQYADYAMWQRNWLEAGEKERQLSYWRKQLGENQPVLQLPTDHPRLASAHYRAARHDFALPALLIARLQQQAQRQGATLFMALLAGFQALLQRYTGQNDIRIGVPIANRHRVEIEHMVGFFVNTQVLRNRIDGRTPLSLILEQTREAALAAQMHQDLPFEQLVEALQPERSLTQQPLFQVMFNHLRLDRRALEQLPGLKVEEYELSGQTAQFELTLDTVEKPNGQFSARFTYAGELFEPATIQRLGAHYLHLLEQLAGHPECRLGDIALLSEAELAQLKAWGVNQRRYADTEPVHRLIERQVAERPEAIALIFGDTELSYAELNRRANRLAHRLIALGVTPETRVGIAAERSIEMIVGLLAILKAGGAYVPLDPAYPRERLHYMVRDSAIALLLTQSAIRERIPHAEGCQVVELDTLDLTDWPQNNPQVSLHGEHLAYLIYTSGSTGKPKGVMVRHHALSHFVMSMLELPGMTVKDTLVSVTALSFDIAGLEIYLPLSAGARLVLAPQAASHDGSILAQLLQTYQVSILQSTPAGWRVLLASGWQALPEEENQPPLKCLCGGEALPIDLVDQLRALNVELWNMYGPTETTIWSVIGRIDQRAISLGNPIAATQLYILDAEMKPVPYGVVGELYLGGMGLARGYLNKPGLTAERFIADPFADEGGRLYRTGDLARWRADGQIEYLGRLDYQVKIRGFRIELGEIEAQLLSHPEVREAVVAAKEAPSGARLVAYVSLHAGSTVDTAVLRESIGKALPDYMVPSAIVMLERLPLNANGKVDRKLLPEPEFAGADAYEAPQGEVEETLAAVWVEVLGISQVGRNDHFFMSGGHSLAVLQVQQKLRQRLSISLPLHLYFENPVLRDMASVIQDKYSLRSKENTALHEMSELLDLLGN
ncbi:non-ribosomal peptide synthetase [Nitrosomonas sp. Nm132]|uniref:non-ribosomal peptide synthetase n=1 Tax=Nitrosomonas sp. Nm132 TaxID=1881053 RepID=UPI00088852CF|nr:non-ribosomal peptide synthetase [Nitrosomonas sp. Nm132]SDH31993.1 amino acid adenylation domain-containing protein [Nitrosomonas sp. Nm132]